MKVLELEPKKVFHYFKELSDIPRGSGNTKEVEKYCLDFAKNHELESYQDAYGNVMIFKEASPGYESHAPVILQGHLDMVCEKTVDCGKDMDREPVELCTDGNLLWANGTTLGADDGIAIAYILAVLDSANLKHPPIEALFTVDEEVGLLGAAALDVSKLKGTRMINIDSEEEGILTVSCAGAVRQMISIPISRGEAAECAIQITVSGLLGGHSGVDINSGHKNAIKVMGEILEYVYDRVKFGIASMNAGGRLNVIPQTATAVICCKGKECAAVFKAIQEYNSFLKKDCAILEPDVEILVDSAEGVDIASDVEGTKKLIFTILTLPNGVFSMNPEIKNLVQTSLNVGMINYQDDNLEVGFMIRSNTDYGKTVLKRRIHNMVTYLQGTDTIDSDYAAWEYRKDSPLRDAMIAAYEDLYGEAPVISTMHAGLECGIIAEKIKDGDFVSFGPTMRNVHTPKEELDVHSAERGFRYLIHTLELL